MGYADIPVGSLDEAPGAEPPRHLGRVQEGRGRPRKWAAAQRGKWRVL